MENINHRFLIKQVLAQEYATVPYEAEISAVIRYLMCWNNKLPFTIVRLKFGKNLPQRHEDSK